MPGGTTIPHGPLLDKILNPPLDAYGGGGIVEPLEVFDDTDEYSGDDEELTGERDLNRLPARQLRARAEVRGGGNCAERDYDGEDVFQGCKPRRRRCCSQASESGKVLEAAEGEVD